MNYRELVRRAYGDKRFTSKITGEDLERLRKKLPAQPFNKPRIKNNDAGKLAR